MSSSTPPLRSLQDLEKAGLLPVVSDDLERVAAEFSVSITKEMQTLIRPMETFDPIGRQFLPSLAELTIQKDELEDPIGDDAFTPTPGIVHRYPDRVLLKLLQVCPVYCRFCFRREQVGPDQGLLSEGDFEKALLYIQHHPEIWEVILTGGDPLMLSQRRLKEAISRLKSIPHVKILRIHSECLLSIPIG